MPYTSFGDQVRLIRKRRLSVPAQDVAEAGLLFRDNAVQNSKTRHMLEYFAMVRHIFTALRVIFGVNVHSVSLGVLQQHLLILAAHKTLIQHHRVFLDSPYNLLHIQVSLHLLNTHLIDLNRSPIPSTAPAASAPQSPLRLPARDPSHELVSLQESKHLMEVDTDEVQSTELDQLVHPQLDLGGLFQIRQLLLEHKVGAGGRFRLLVYHGEWLDEILAVYGILRG